MTFDRPELPRQQIFIMEDVRQKVESVEGVTAARSIVVLTGMGRRIWMTEEAKLELGFL